MSEWTSGRVDGWENRRISSDPWYHQRSEIPKPPVDDRTRRDLRRVEFLGLSLVEIIETLREMEWLFADEAMTAGLDAAMVNR